MYIEGNQKGAGRKSTEVSLYLLLFFFFSFQSRYKRLPVFFVRGEPVLVLKGSSLHGIFLLSTALFASEVSLFQLVCTPDALIFEYASNNGEQQALCKDRLCYKSVKVRLRSKFVVL